MRAPCDRSATTVCGMQLAVPIDVVNPLRRLYCKLTRELAQSERSAFLHTRREARRLGDTPPARALRAVGAHAAASRRRFDALVESQPIGAMLGRRFGELFSILRNLVFDRILDVERSYRGTLLGFHHGIGVARLLRDVAERLDERDMVAFCDAWLEERRALVENAERELRWFADLPRRAIHSGLHAAFEGAPE